MTWIILVLAYGVIKGLREILKKKALEKSSTIEVLFLYTFISFLIVTPEIRNAGGVPAGTLLFIAVKSLVIFVAWMAGFSAVRHMPVGLYGLLDQSRLVFSMILGLMVLKESMSWGQTVGLLLVIAGLVLLRFGPEAKGGHRGIKSAPEPDRTIAPVAETVFEPDRTATPAAETVAESGRMTAQAAETAPEPGRTTSSAAQAVGRPAGIFVLLTFVSAFFNAVSGLFDKLIMSQNTVTDGQLQFWYMLFLTAYYGLYIVIRRPGINWRGALKNGWIWVLAVLFVIADRFLFIANGDPASRVTVMTVLKQISCIVTILGGRIIFKEKHLAYRLMCAAVVIAGIVISVLQ